MGILSGLLSFLGFGEKTTTGQSVTNKKINMKTVSFENQLETFKKLGFTLNKNVEISDIDRWEDKKEFEKEPYSLLYTTLGQTIEREP